jgi:hypothetical protein
VVLGDAAKGFKEFAEIWAVLEISVISDAYPKSSMDNALPNVITRVGRFHVIIPPLLRPTEMHRLTLPEAPMRMSVKLANGVLVILILVLALSSTASAQVFNDLIIGIVGGDPPCSGLRGRAPDGEVFYGPNLSLLCPNQNTARAASAPDK